jgi:hypothetical protein
MMAFAALFRPAGIVISWTGSSFLVGVVYDWWCCARVVGGVRGIAAKSAAFCRAARINVSGRSGTRKPKKEK